MTVDLTTVNADTQPNARALKDFSEQMPQDLPREVSALAFAILEEKIKWLEIEIQILKERLDHERSR